MSVRYRKRKDGELVVIDPEREIMRISCCDCGLVHDVEFRVKKKKVEMVFWRNRRSTTLRRKGGEFVCC